MNLKNYKIFLKYKLFEIWGIWILSNCVLNEIFWNIVLEFFIGGLWFFFFVLFRFMLLLLLFWIVKWCINLKFISVFVYWKC